jgi:hypothetical protein
MGSISGTSRARFPLVFLSTRPPGDGVVWRRTVQIHSSVLYAVPEEAICAAIKAHADTATDRQPALDVDHELHEIAWSVAGLLQLRHSDTEENPDARAEHTDLLDQCRTAVLERVVALYDYHLALQRTRRDVEGLQARRCANTPTTVDVATAAADEFLNRQAAARIAYLTENFDIARVLSTHLASTEMSTTMAKPGRIAAGIAAVASDPDQPPNTSSAATAAAHTADTIESASQSATFGRDGAAEI